VDRATGIAEYAPNWDWHGVPLLDLLTEHIAYPLYLDNPLRASAVAELWFGAARGRGDAVVVNLGTGVGAGLVLGGGLHRGVSNSAGEWGHTTMVLDGRLCRCGNHGCVEAYVGARGIMLNLRELSPDSALLHAEDQTATIDALARGVAADDPVARQVVHDTARYLGAGVADLVNLFNPEIVVLSSWVARTLGEPLLHEVREAVNRHALPRPLAATEVVLSPIPHRPRVPGCGDLRARGRAPGRRAEERQAHRRREEPHHRPTFVAAEPTPPHLPRVRNREPDTTLRTDFVQPLAEALAEALASRTAPLFEPSGASPRAVSHQAVSRRAAAALETRTSACRHRAT
jgi:predicted NBD/HSP70 family sugar kinase